MIVFAGDPAQRPPYVVFFDACVLIPGNHSFAAPLLRIVRRDDYYRLLAFMIGVE